MIDDTVLAAIPRPIDVGPEHDALRRFHRDGTWEGRIQPEGMGPGTPAQMAYGSAKHEWIQEGRWVVGEYAQDQYLEDGSLVLRWELHWVCGWDPVANEYRATTADNYGRVAVLRGRIEGDVMVFESMGDTVPSIRLTWDLSEEGVVLWKNEMSFDGREWALIEDYRIFPTS